MTEEEKKEFNWKMLVKIHDEGVNLTNWETKFIDDIFFKFTIRKSTNLTPRQEEILERIYTERTN